MDELCTACLCMGRNLYFIGETGCYHLYTQILNEIPVYDQSQVSVRVCWECRALLRRLQLFKTQVKRSYSELLRHVHQNTPLASITRSPHLQIQHISSIDYPQEEIKLEFDNDIDLGIDNVKTEAVETETHCEPEAFVNNLALGKLEKPRGRKKGAVSKTNKKKVKKKLKKKKKLDKSEDSVKLDDTDGLSDLDSILDYYEDTTEKVEKETEKVEKEAENVEKETEKVENEGVKRETEAQPQVERVKRGGARGGAKGEPLAERPQCTECGKVFSSRKTYRYHLNVLHKGQNRYPCPRCGKVYQWKSNLGRHMRSHKARDTGELYCDACDKRFASVATYRQHLRVSRRHVSETEFSDLAI